MKSTVKYWLQFGIVIVMLTGSLLAQAPATAAGAQQTAGKTGARESDSTYLIGAEDVLAINVWKEPDLTRSTPVRTDGKISLPLIGEVQAAGRTPLQLENDISAKLHAFITDPQVTVMVEQVNSKKVNILGQVVKPGSYSIVVAPTVMDAIAAAGGFRDFARTKDVYILRQGANGSQSKIGFNYKDFVKGKNPAQNIKLEPHDTIIVP